MKRFIYWIIVILGTGFIFITSYRIGENLAIWHNSKNMPKRKITVTVEKTKNLIDNYKDILQYIKYDGLTEDLKLNVVFNQLESFEKPDSKYTCEDAFTSNEIKEDNYICDNINQDGNTTSYPYSIVNKYYKELYGKELNKVDYNGSKYFNEYFEYSSKLDIYVELLNKFGESNTKEVYNYYDIISKNYENNILDVEIAYITYEKIDNKFEYVLNGLNKPFDSEEQLDQIFSDNKEQLPRLKFKFKKVDNNFILEEIK